MESMSIIESAKQHQARAAEFGVPRIVVVGAGGAGCNTVNRLCRAGMKGAELIAVNTDSKHLTMMGDSVRKVLIGKSLTKGLGTGGYPEIGAKAAEASKRELEQVLENVDLVFLAAGMGGGTGTGSSPVIAEIAKKNGAIVIAMVTYPFLLERARLKKAAEGIDALGKVADTIVVIDNNRLVNFVPNLPIEQAFNLADEITARAVYGITETIATPSLINLDYADVKSIMQGGGVSMIAVGEGTGVERGKRAVESTLHNRLLEVDYTGAKGVLIHITGSPDMTLGEANQVGEALTEAVDQHANVIWGARLDPNFNNKIESMAIFTGINSPYIVGGGTEKKRV